MATKKKGKPEPKKVGVIAALCGVLGELAVYAIDLTLFVTTNILALAIAVLIMLAGGGNGKSKGKGKGKR